MRLWARMFDLLFGLDGWDLLGSIGRSIDDSGEVHMMDDPTGPPPPRP